MSTELVLTDDRPQYIRVEFSTIAEQERRALRGLVSLASGPTPDLTLVRRNSNYVVGRALVRGTLITVPPPATLPAESFVDLLLYALGGDLRGIAAPGEPVAVERRLRSDYFLSLFGHLLVATAERTLATRLAKTYERIEARRRTLKGRILWSANFGRRPVDGLVTRSFELTSDNLLNRIVLAGLRAAIPFVRSPAWSSRLTTQLFIWRELADEVSVSYSDISLALLRIDRLTEHYRVPINLARALLLGFAPNDLFAPGDADLQLLQFSLPSLFEQMVHRLIADSIAGSSVQVSYQDEDLRAIVDETGATYRAIRPDIALYRSGRPIAVIDAKFKPRYVDGYPGTVPESARATNDDLYQLFFYQVRLQHRHHLDEPPQCLIVAPQLTEAPGYDLTRRTVRWHGTRDWHGLRIVSIDLLGALASLRQGEAPRDVLARNSELRTYLDGWTRDSGAIGLAPKALIAQ